MKPSRIIDTHQHVFWHGRDDEGLVRDMDEHGIAYAWLLTWEISRHPGRPEPTMFSRVLNPARVRDDGTHPGIRLEDLLYAHRRHPGRFVLGYCPDPSLPEAAELFEAACEMYGVRVCGEWKFRMLIHDPRSLELFRAAGRRKAPVVLHLDAPYLPPHGEARKYSPYWYGGSVEDLGRALEACPETTFIGHAPGFWREISGDADREPAVYPKGPIVTGGRLEPLFARYRNLYADLSAGSALFALQRDPAHARDFLVRHQDRLLFGRDDYGQDLHRFLGGLDLPAETVEKIYHGNAEALLGIRSSCDQRGGPPSPVPTPRA